MISDFSLCSMIHPDFIACSLMQKGYLHLCPRKDFLLTLHIYNSLYINYENVFIELDS